MKIYKHSVVTLDYTLKNESGTVLDTSEGAQPLVYLHGVGGLIPGMERAVEGKKKGASFKAVIKPKDGYGQRDDSKVLKVSKDNFQGTEELTVGMQIQMENKKGKQIATVTDIQGKDVTVDANHPLAGIDLHFEVTIQDVRQATPEEIEHGHVHGVGGHHHH